MRKKEREGERVADMKLMKLMESLLIVRTLVSFSVLSPIFTAESAIRWVILSTLIQICCFFLRSLKEDSEMSNLLCKIALGTDKIKLGQKRGFKIACYCLHLLL